MKEKSAGAAKDIRAKVAEKTEIKGKAEEPTEEVTTVGEDKAE